MAIKKIDRANIDFNKIYKNSNDAKNETNATRVSERYQEYWGDNGTQLFFDEDTGAVYEASPDATDMTGATRLGFIGSVINENSTTQVEETNAPAVVDSSDVSTNIENNNQHIQNISSAAVDTAKKMEDKVNQTITDNSNNSSNSTPSSNENNNVHIININSSAEYSGNVHTKSKASSTSKSDAGVVTSDNQSYQVGTTTNIDEGVLSQEDYLYLVGQVAGESANDTDDMLGVCTTILNRAEDGGYGGKGIEGVLKKGYWPWGKTCNKYLNYDNSGRPIGFKTREQLGDIEYAKLESVSAVVNDAMNGTRNLNKSTVYYSGDGKHNYFSDVV